MDFAVDVPNLALQWFRETVRVEHNAFVQPSQASGSSVKMGRGKSKHSTLGSVRTWSASTTSISNADSKHESKRGPRIRITVIRIVLQIEFESILPRVERQIGGRVPTEVGTLEQVIATRFEFQPFAKLKIIDHAVIVEPDSSLSFETYCTGVHLRSIAEND